MSSISVGTFQSVLVTLLSLSHSLFFTVDRYSLLATVSRLSRLTPAVQLRRFCCKPRNFYARSIAIVRLPRSPARSQVELRLVISSLQHFLQCTAKYKRTTLCNGCTFTVMIWVQSKIKVAAPHSAPLSLFSPSLFPPCLSLSHSLSFSLCLASALVEGITRGLSTCQSSIGSWNCVKLPIAVSVSLCVWGSRCCTSGGGGLISIKSALRLWDNRFYLTLTRISSRISFDFWFRFDSSHLVSSSRVQSPLAKVFTGLLVVWLFHQDFIAPIDVNRLRRCCQIGSRLPRATGLYTKCNSFVAYQCSSFVYTFIAFFTHSLSPSLSLGLSLVNVVLFFLVPSSHISEPRNTDRIKESCSCTKEIKNFNREIPSNLCVG